MFNNDFERQQELLRQQADCNARLALIPYEGTVEVKSQGGSQYLYVRKRVAGKLTSTYVGPYSEELHQLLLHNAAEARGLRKQLRQIRRSLAELGYSSESLPERVILNLDFARANMSASIYDQAVLEGVATSFPQTEEIINNGHVNGMSASDVQKVLNLKHAWEFVLDEDVLGHPSTLPVLSHIARLVNEGFFADGGRIRGVPVSIGGTSYVPPLPQETAVAERISEIVDSGERPDAVGSPGLVDPVDPVGRVGPLDQVDPIGPVNPLDPVDVSIALALYCMKTQVFLDGNKRAAIIFANHYLIAHGGGLLVVPQEEVSRFKELLVNYYEGQGAERIVDFMKERCWRRF